MGSLNLKKKKLCGNLKLYVKELRSKTLVYTYQMDHTVKKNYKYRKSLLTY